MAMPPSGSNSLTPSRLQELEQTCFVIMPFGKKKVGDKEVDFTWLYTELFEPAIQAAKTPEGQALIPARTDMDAFSGSINQEMFEYLMYSRMAFADISGFNPNVFYEIGVRHATQEAGTVLFRQLGHAIPFDITTIKVFEYDEEGEAALQKSRELITHVLTETLRRNRLDSPVRLALRAQWGGSSAPAAAPLPAAATLAGEQVAAPAPVVVDEQALEQRWRRRECERLMQEAEEALRLGDLPGAQACYQGVLRFDALNVIARMRLGLTHKMAGRYQEALEEFTTLTRLAPGYGEAWKEKGVIEGLIARSIAAEKRPKWLNDGSSSLQRAALLIPGDFDVWSSLGGVLKNVRGERVAARRMYQKAAELSDGHPYPLLNALKLEALETGTLDLQSVSAQLATAESLRRAQAEATPPTDVPWCFFDLAEIHLYQQDVPGFLEWLGRGIASCNADWQLTTCRKSLHDTLVARGIALDGLDAGMALLDEAIARWAR